MFADRPVVPLQQPAGNNPPIGQYHTSQQQHQNYQQPAPQQPPPHQQPAQQPPQPPQQHPAGIQNGPSEPNMEDQRYGATFCVFSNIFFSGALFSLF